jgi:HEAT repeat protein
MRMLAGLFGAVLMVVTVGCSGRVVTQEDEIVVQSFNAAQISEVREQAIQLLRAEATAPEPVMRANALESMRPAIGRAEDLLRSGLADENPGVRFVAAMLCGQEKRLRLVRYVRPLLRDDYDWVRAAAIFALVQCGEPIDPSTLSGYVMSPNPVTRSNTAMILAEMGNPSALPMLRDAARTPMPRVSTIRAKITQLQLAEAMVRLGDEEAIKPIRAALHAPQEEGELQALAAQMIGKLGDKGAEGSLIMLTARREEFLSAEVRLACAASLAQLGRPEGRFIADAYRANESSALRAQSAYVYGQIGTPDCLTILIQMMQDPDPVVRVYAAGAVLHMTAR